MQQHQSQVGNIFTKYFVSKTTNQVHFQLLLKERVVVITNIFGYTNHSSSRSLPEKPGQKVRVTLQHCMQTNPSKPLHSQ